LGDGADRRQGLAPKAEAPNPDEIASRSNLRCRVASEGEYGVVARHAGAVVAHAHELSAAVLDGDVDRRRSRVERILDKLLHDRGRTFDDFTRRDLIGDGAGKNGDD